MTLALAATAPLIASLYGEPRLVAITIAMSFNVLLNSLGSIHGALLVREGRLGVQLRIGLIAGLASGSVGLLLALRGHGAWSLVGQSLCGSFLGTILLWTWHRWRPIAAFSGQALRPLLQYGGALMLCDLLEAVFGRLHTLLIGRLYGAAPLGLYMRASTTQQLPKMMLGSVMQKVTFPLLSSERGDASLLLGYTRVSLRAASALYVPAMLGLAATAEALVPFLFGIRWMPSVPILQVLCIAGALYPLHQVNLTLLKAMGHSSLFLQLEILKKSILVGLLLIAIPMGMLAVAWSQVAAGVTAVLINARYSKTLIGYGLASQLRDFAPSAIAGAAMAMLVWWQGTALSLSNGMTLLVQVSTGIVVYCVACLGLGLVVRDEIRVVMDQLRQGPAP
jgi:O-antigen/teichoic acid export membrane protein